MKTLDEIKNEVAEIYLYHDFETALDLFQKGAISQVTFDGFVNQILVGACKEALKNASENAEFIAEHQFYEETIKDSVDNVGSHLVFIDKQSILSESNIPKL